MTWKRAGWVFDGGVLMEKIVLVSREPANRRRLIAMVKRLFPECAVEVVARTGSGLESVRNPVDKETGVRQGKAVVFGN